jgi:hypothetical protein
LHIRYKTFCHKTSLELKLNDYITNDIPYEEIHMQAVQDALFFPWGIIKDGLAFTGEVLDIDGVNVPVTKCFVANVQFDDFVLDMAATGNHLNCQYMGDRYPRIREELIKELKADKEKNEKIIAKIDGGAAETTNEEKSTDSQTGGENSVKKYKDTVYVWDIWLLKERKVIQCIDDNGKPDADGLIREFKYTGPKKGMYKLLSFLRVPGGNILPIPQVSVWRDINMIANLIFRKIKDNALAQKHGKTVGKSGEDGGKIEKFKDGDILALNNPTAVGDIKVGGIDNQTLGFFITLRDLYAYLAGNLDMLGGLGPQSETLGQDELLNQSASQRLISMKKQDIKFQKEILNDVAYFIYTDIVKDFFLELYILLLH